jgi:hypothetical protein
MKPLKETIKIPNESLTDDTPPFFKSWNKIYLFVLSVLIILIFLFYWFSISFK